MDLFHWFKQKQEILPAVRQPTPFADNGLSLRKADAFHPVDSSEINASEPDDIMAFSAMLYSDQFNGKTRSNHVCGVHNAEYLHGLFDKTPSFIINNSFYQFGLMTIDKTNYMVSRKVIRNGSHQSDYHIRAIGPQPVDDILSAYKASVTVERARKNMLEKPVPAPLKQPSLKQDQK